MDAFDVPGLLASAVCVFCNVSVLVARFASVDSKCAWGDCLAESAGGDGELLDRMGAAEPVAISSSERLSTTTARRRLWKPVRLTGIDRSRIRQLPLSCEMERLVCSVFRPTCWNGIELLASGTVYCESKYQERYLPAHRLFESRLDNQHWSDSHARASLSRAA